MAGDWIKMRRNLLSDPDVLRIAETVGVDRYAVVGRLLAVWGWADEHSVSGNAVSVTSAFLDEHVSCDGFCAAMRKVGWLDGRDWCLSFPNFDRHNGETAKKRAQTAKRVKRTRNADSVTEALPEKRRVEKKDTHTHTPRTGQEIELTEDMLTGGFPEAWQRWLQWVEATTGRPMPAMQAQTILMQLGHRGPAKAAADIDFSIAKSAKSILDSSHDFEKQRTQTQATKREFKF